MKCVPIIFLGLFLVKTIHGEYENRIGKFFPFYYSVVRFENGICLGKCNLYGTCYTRRECRKLGGTASGKCAKGLGVCCVVQKSCGSSVQVNNTYFQNPDFPLPYAGGGGKCTTSIQRIDSNICQLRLDFLTFDLAQPNGNGSCMDDSFMVYGGAVSVPIICGENTGQHLYVDFFGDNPVQLTIKTNSALSKTRSWNIKATQIACDSAERAPTGCLQYYRTPSGTVQSFNYDPSPNSNQMAFNATGTRQMLGSNYGICIEKSGNFCGIKWMQSGMFSFTVSNNTETAVNGSTVGTEAAEIRGINCTHDFVVIANAKVNASDPGADRFCGNGFAMKVSYAMPFVLYVVTDEDETNGGAPNSPDVANRGFSLDYTQVSCSD